MNVKEFLRPGDLVDTNDYCGFKVTRIDGFELRSERVIRDNGALLTMKFTCNAEAIDKHVLGVCLYRGDYYIHLSLFGNERDWSISCNGSTVDEAKDINKTVDQCLNDLYNACMKLNIEV